MRTSEAIDQLATALALAQGEIKPAVKDAKNPAFNSDYADLAAVLDAARGPLAKHGLSVVQMAEHSDDALVHVTTRVCHKSGQWIEGTMSLPVGKISAHGYGSAITYARRYQLKAALCMADRDDDGNEAAQNAPSKSNFLPAPIPANTEGHALFAALPVDAQTVVRDDVAEMSALVAQGDLRGALAILNERYTTHEDQLILASQMDSGPRNKLKAFKREQEAPRTQVAPGTKRVAALASQP